MTTTLSKKYGAGMLELVDSKKILLGLGWTMINMEKQNRAGKVGRLTTLSQSRPVVLMI